MSDAAPADALHPYALTLEYDGSGFSGWQRQPGRRTVEGTLLAAIAAVTGEEVRLTAAGRTDAGAHAHGQVAGCSLRRGWDPGRLRAALNAVLPADVVVVEAAPAPAGFHARLDAVARSYRYVVMSRGERSAVARQYAWRVRGPLDLAAMRRVAASLVGTHDFAAFGRSPRRGGSTTRRVDSVRLRQLALAERRGIAPQSAVVIEVVADAFLYGMMRSIAGALVAVGLGRMRGEQLAALVQRPPAQRPPLPVAPAHGLHQWRVTYPQTVTR